MGQIYTTQVAVEVLVPFVEGNTSTPGIKTRRFDANLGDDEVSVSWYLIPQLSDSDHELRAKVIKAVRVAGKLTDANFQVYTYGPEAVVDVSDLEEGILSITGEYPLTDTNVVTVSERIQVNCPNASLHTVRVAGTWDGVGSKDRIDEIEYEQAIQDARR